MAEKKLILIGHSGCRYTGGIAAHSCSVNPLLVEVPLHKLLSTHGRHGLFNHTISSEQTVQK